MVFKTAGALITVTTEGAVLVTDPEVAVMLAVPGATGVTNPAELTVATAVLDEDQVIVVAIVEPYWSRVVAVSC